jgi:UDP-glucose:glycoprotein glucosyltransferase
MDVPSSWLVRPRESEHDLDNIHLASLSTTEHTEGVKALFDLDFLVIEGHARDISTGGPARGLQLQLTSQDLAPVADTLVMENLGYLQFKAKPGVFQLEIMKGRGEDIFVTDSVGNEGWNSPPVDGDAGAQVTLTSFEGLTLYPRFKRHLGKGDADVLTPPREGFLTSTVQKVVSAYVSNVIYSEGTLTAFPVSAPGFNRQRRYQKQISTFSQ